MTPTTLRRLPAEVATTTLATIAITATAATVLCSLRHDWQRFAFCATIAAVTGSAAVRLAAGRP